MEPRKTTHPNPPRAKFQAYYSKIGECENTGRCVSGQVSATCFPQVAVLVVCALPIFGDKIGPELFEGCFFRAYCAQAACLYEARVKKRTEDTAWKHIFPCVCILWFQYYEKGSWIKHLPTYINSDANPNPNSNPALTCMEVPRK